MLKADKLKVEGLVASDEALRIESAVQLQALEPGHFEDHPISVNFVKGIEEKLLAAYRDTDSPLVREWVLQVLASASIESDELVSIVSAALTPECPYLPTLLYYIWQSAHKFPNIKEQVKLLCSHPDPQVRWRCALVLEKIPLDYKNDVGVIRALMTDEYYTTRTYAVLALKKLGKVGFFDRRALKKVIKIDDGAARTYANELLGK